MTIMRNTFLGLDPLDVRQAEVVVVPVPYEATITYGGGTRQGPGAIISASQQVELWDEEDNWDPSSVVKVATVLEITPDAGGPGAMLEKIKRVVKPWIQAGKILITLGGEHSITRGLVESYLTKYPDLTVVVWDAHADLRDKYDHSPLSHACANRRVWELGRPVTILGVRSYCREEYDFFRVAPRLTIFPMKDLRTGAGWQKAIEHLQAIRGPVYLSIDVDALDPAVMPGTGTPEPGGLTYPQMLELVRTVCRRGPVVGMDVVELAPIPGQRRGEFTAARLIYRCLGYIVGEQRGGSQ